MSFFRRLALFLSITCISIAVDQLTKELATQTLKGQPARFYFGNVLRLTWAQNEGAFLSLGSTLSKEARYWILTVGVGVLLCILIGYALSNRKLDRIQIASYALLASGGIANWVDRARFEGKVVDFVQLGIGSMAFTGVFNIADLAIICGAVLLFWLTRREDRLQRQQRAQAIPTQTE